MTEYPKLYDKLVPKDHVLRKMNDLVDYSFVVDELRDKYCPNNGRNSKDPVRLFKYTQLKAMYTVSDVDIVERSRYDLSFKYFLGYAPEDEVIHPSLLTKFRKLRLTDEGILDMLIEKSVQIAIEHGIIKSDGIIVDSVHTASRYHNRRPEEVLRDQAKAVRKAVYGVKEGMKEKFPKKVESDKIEDNLEYCKELIAVVAVDPKLMINQAVSQSVNLLQEIVDDDLENLKTSEDEDAKVGHKTADTSFFGYKTHTAVTQEGIITAAVVTSGEKHDGKQVRPLVEKSRKAGMKVNYVNGDGAFSEKDNIEYAKDNFKLVSKLSSAVVNGLRSKEDEFEFNKDADMFVCKAGHMAISKSRHHNKQPERKENPRIVYYFDVEKCKRCPMREGCYKGTKTKSYSVSLTSDVQLEHKALQETEEYKEIAKTRYKVEQKNADLKNNYGYREAESSGIQAMRIQGATAIFSANMARIIRLLDE